MSALTSTTARVWSGSPVREARLHLRLPRRVGRVGNALDARPRGVELEQLVGEIRHRLPDALLRPEPLRPTELREVRVLGAAVAGDTVDLLDRDEDLVGAGEAQLEVVTVLAVGLVAAPEHPLVAGNAVVDVDDEISGRQPLEDVAGDDPAEGLGPPDPDGTEQLAVGHEDEAVRAALESAVEASLDERDGSGRRGLRGVGHATAWPASSSSARRGAWSDARTIRRPSSCQPSTAPPIAAARPAGRTGSRQPKTSPEPARAPPTRPTRAARLPGQLERAARDQDATSRDAGRRRSRASLSAGRPCRSASARRSSAWRHRKSAASATSPGSSMTIRVLSGNMVQPGRRSEQRRPDFGGVAGLQSL